MGALQVMRLWSPDLLEDPDYAQDVERRLYAKAHLLLPTGCLVWAGSAGSSGYGQVSVRGRQRSTHVVAYLLRYGDFDQSLVLDHLCRMKLCFNTDHLEPVPQSINILRGDGPAAVARAHRAVTHCPHGHEYSAENTRLKYRPDGSVKQRLCITCCRESSRRRYWNSKS